MLSLISSITSSSPHSLPEVSSNSAHDHSSRDCCFSGFAFWTMN